ncbi:MAG: rod shape-determining protein MreC [Chloroflexi bacterium]|nr:rod shape-determining protein MreC [Chloroflexota bacterium]
MLARLGYLIAVLAIGFGVVILFRLPRLGLIESGAFAALGPATSAVGAPVRSLVEFVQTIQSIGELRRENAQLRQEIADLRAATARLPEVERENALYRSQLQLRLARPTLQWQVARIIGRDTNPLVKAIIIDLGSADGLAEGMTVMTTEGLVGQLVRLHANTAKVLLIVDVGSSVNGTIQDSRARGVVYGARTGELAMRYIAQGESVKTGDRVLTSGLGGIYPPGIPIGRVVDVRQKDIDMFQEARLDPAVAIDKLEEVLVITNHLPVKLE